MKFILSIFILLMSGSLWAFPSLVGTWQCDKGGRLIIGADGRMVADVKGLSLAGTYTMTNRGYIFSVMGQTHEDVITVRDSNTFERYPVESPSFRDTCRRISNASCTPPNKCLSGNCVNGFGREDLGDGDYFEGTFANCDWAGKGTLVYHTGASFEAYWPTRFKFPERVVVTDPSRGYRYEGGLAGGKLSGHGVTTFFKDVKQDDGTTTLKGTRMEADWVDNKLSGHCTITAPDGSGYDGEMRNNLRNGHGTLKHANGSWYRGNWKNGVATGQGTMHFTDGEYAGDWLNDKRHGHGTFKDLEGNIYIGEWQDDTRSGQGTYTERNGRKYVGMWKNGKRHGQGIQYKPDGSVEAQAAFVDDNPPR